jgi:inorganic pyrophosphatase
LPAGSISFEFVFVPSTLGEDGDRIDIVVLMDAASCMSCTLQLRVIGAIRAESQERKTFRNDRLIGMFTLAHT